MVLGLCSENEPTEKQVEAGENVINKDEQLLRQLGYTQVGLL